MTNSKVAHRYALSLIEIAEESGNSDAVTRDIGTLRDLMAGSREFANFLKSPVINLHRKQKLLTAILGGKVCDLVLRFVLLLAAKTRTPILQEVIRQYDILLDERKGVVSARVRTVVPLTAGEQQLLAERIRNHTGKTVRMQYDLDPSLKAGFTVQYDDTVWDASVRRQLEVLRRRLVHGDD